MKEFVLVEFIVFPHERTELMGKIHDLGDDFEEIDVATEWTEDQYNSLVSQFHVVSGRLNAMCATVIKLRDPFLADRMRVSYISDDIKNIYRR